MGKGFLLGVVATIAAMALGAYLVVVFGLFPANADTRPSKIEFWAARTSLHATLARRAPKTADPVPLSDANLLGGLKLYKQNCAVCHGTAKGDAAQSNIAKGLFRKRRSWRRAESKTIPKASRIGKSNTVPPHRHAGIRADAFR